MSAHISGVGDTGITTISLRLICPLAVKEPRGKMESPGHVPGMGMCRVAAPEDNPVRTVLDLPESTGRKACILNCNQGSAVAGCCGIVTACRLISAISLPTLWASQLVEDQPNMTVFSHVRASGQCTQLPHHMRPPSMTRLPGASADG